MMSAARALRHDRTVPIKIPFITIQLLLLISPAIGTHFRGGYISWSAVSPSITNASIVTIAIQQMYSWANSVVPCGQLIGTAGFLHCISANCSNYMNNVSVQLPCIGFDLGLDVSTGSGATLVNLLAGSQIVIGYQSTNWVSLVYGPPLPAWSIITHINLAVRSDNGRINSSPTSSIAPLVTVLVNLAQTFRIPIADADLDVVQCRWAKNATVVNSGTVNECAGVCQNIPSAQLYSTADLQNNCTLVFTVSIAGYYAIALQIEDFMPSNVSGPALSSIPLQFLVLAMNTSCNAPTIIGELSNGVTSQVPFGSAFIVSVIAQVSCNGTSVTRFSTVIIPPGTAGTSTVVSANASLYSIIFTWTPTVDQVGTTQLYCTLAVASNNLQSAQYCLNFIVVNATTSTTIAVSSTSASSVTTPSNTTALTVGLSVGLGLTALALLGLLSALACCRYYPNSYCSQLRRKCFPEKSAPCSECESQKLEKMKPTNDDAKLYRSQYINEQNPFEDDSFATTSSTWVSRFSNGIAPIEAVQSQFSDPSSNVPSQTSKGSILVRAFKQQEVAKHDSLH